MSDAPLGDHPSRSRWRRTGESRLGERLVYFVIVPLIVIGVVVLGAIALRTTLGIENKRRQSAFDFTWQLATDRLTLLETNIVTQDTVVAAHVDVANLRSMPKRWLTTAARETPTVRAIVVLDMTYDEHEVRAFASRFPGPEDDAFRRVLLLHLLPSMDMGGDTEELRHLQEAVDETEYLLSYWQRSEGKNRYLVVAWHDVNRIVKETMPAIYRDPGRGNARMNVVDEKGRIVYGPPIKVGEFGVSASFPSTLKNWRLQLALADAEDIGQEVEKTHLVELAMIITAGMVAFFGLVVVISASLRDRRLSVLKSDFVANVSHELKTPLALIRMFGELLLSERIEGAEKKKKYYQIIVSESERLTALIENVLDFARVERGNVAYDFQPANPGEVVRHAIEIYRYRAEKEGVKIVDTIAENLPELMIDARALELGLMNLLDNALKYAKGTDSVAVAVQRVRGWIVISVTDQGPGIPRDEQEQIFERFFRGKNASNSQARGSGIGLALVRHIAKSHGGRVQVKSPVEGDRGTSFSIFLPG